MKIYIAGKITGENREDVIEKFESAKRVLTEKGFDVLVPTVLPVLDSLTHEDYLHICYAMIDVCDAVVLLPDWVSSKGAKLERQYAADHNKKIFFEKQEVF